MTGDRRRRGGGSARAIGVYTTIPSLLLAGPLVGYYLGHLAGKQWGHATAWEVGGGLLGTAAAIRQVWILIRQTGSDP